MYEEATCEEAKERLGNTQRGMRHNVTALLSEACATMSQKYVPCVHTQVSHISTPVLVPDGDKLEQGNWRVGGMRLAPRRAGASMQTCAAGNSTTIKDYVGNTTEYADHPAASSSCSHEDSSTLPAACSCRAPIIAKSS